MNPLPPTAEVLTRQPHPPRSAASAGCENGRRRRTRALALLLPPRHHKTHTASRACTPGPIRARGLAGGRQRSICCWLARSARRYARSGAGWWPGGAAGNTWGGRQPPPLLSCVAPSAQDSAAASISSSRLHTASPTGPAARPPTPVAPRATWLLRSCCWTTPARSKVHRCPSHRCAAQRQQLVPVAQPARLGPRAHRQARRDVGLS